MRVIHTCTCLDCMALFVLDDDSERKYCLAMVIRYNGPIYVSVDGLIHLLLDAGFTFTIELLVSVLNKVYSSATTITISLGYLRDYDGDNLTMPLYMLVSFCTHKYLYKFALNFALRCQILPVEFIHTNWHVVTSVTQKK